MSSEGQFVVTPDSEIAQALRRAVRSCIHRPAEGGVHGGCGQPAVARVFSFQA